MAEKWNARRMEEELAHALQAMLTRDAEDDETELSPGVAALAGQLSDLLQNQALFRAEIDSLRQEIQMLKQEKQELTRSYQQQVAGLEAEVRMLRDERDNWVRTLLEEIHGHGGAGQPKEGFLRLPLVIRNAQGDYLGVAGREKAFCLREFIHLIEKNAGPGKVVTVRFSREDQGWTLVILTLDNASRERHEHLMHLRRVVTPSRNEVVELASMSIDGQAVPQPFLLELFKKIKMEMGA